MSGGQHAIPTVLMEGPGGQVRINHDDEAMIAKYADMDYEIIEGEAAVAVEEAEEAPDLGAMKVAELRALCEERGIDHDGLKKDELIEALS